MLSSKIAHLLKGDANVVLFYLMANNVYQSLEVGYWKLEF
jgi:hypothetical protein